MNKRTRGNFLCRFHRADYLRVIYVSNGDEHSPSVTGAIMKLTPRPEYFPDFSIDRDFATACDAESALREYERLNPNFAILDAGVPERRGSGIFAGNSLAQKLMGADTKPTCLCITKPFAYDFCDVSCLKRQIPGEEGAYASLLKLWIGSGAWKGH